VVKTSDIRNYARRIAERYAPEKIILFGSHAYGKPSEDSDVDLLVIMPVSGRSVYKAAEIQTAIPAPFPADILVRSRGKIRNRLRMGDCFVKEIMSRGHVLYEAADAGMD
jgi:predicted nucleotidyltransferase